MDICEHCFSSIGKDGPVEILDSTYCTDCVVAADPIIESTEALTARYLQLRGYVLSLATPYPSSEEGTRLFLTRIEGIKTYLQIREDVEYQAKLVKKAALYDQLMRFASNVGGIPCQMISK